MNHNSIKKRLDKLEAKVVLSALKMQAAKPSEKLDYESFKSKLWVFDELHALMSDLADMQKTELLQLVHMTFLRSALSQQYSETAFASFKAKA